ncbi:unnamed protein product [Adineta steineri]|uniref:Uncharacterized protein n=1 Tax=Adineta steineri TaxID=433720 RepID=A0A815IZC3_9BILA|nr:unnamed protein product [Adineta steineri]
MSETITEKLSLIVNETFNQYHKSFVIISGTVLTGWLYNKYWINRRLFSSCQSMEGKTVLITGGNTGIGYETAKDLLQRGARVIIACRNVNKGYEAIHKLVNESGCSKLNIRVMECDLCSFDSVRNLAKLYNEEEDRLDILICNAGLGYSSTIITKDGFNPVIQTNYLSHFLLTNLLLNKLKQSKPTVKSIDWSDALTQFHKTSLFGAYAPSKLFQILSTYKLKQDLLDNEDINSFSLTPGLVSTSIKDPMEESINFFTSIFYYPLFYLMKFLFSKTPQSGAQTSIYCTIQSHLQKSKDLYFENCTAVKSSPLTMDPLLAEKLWTISCQAVGI